MFLSVSVNVFTRILKCYDICMEQHSFEKIELSEQAHELEKEYLDVLANDPDGASKKIVNFVHDILLKNHTKEELYDYEAYCVAASCSLIKQPEHFDLEGDESIVQFIKRLAKEADESKEK